MGHGAGSEGGSCNSRRQQAGGDPKETTMSANFEQIQQFGKEQVEAVQAATSEFAKGLQAIATEASEYSKKSIENSSAFVAKLSATKQIDEALKLQAEFAKTSYEDFIAQSAKLGELYTNFAKQAFKPVESAIAKVQGK
jgi:phasin family protein